MRSGQERDRRGPKRTKVERMCLPFARAFTANVSRNVEL
jgi:hypothetical protein